MIRLRFITLTAVAVVAGAVVAAKSLQAAVVVFFVLSCILLLYANQTKHVTRNVVRATIALCCFWCSFFAAQRTLHVLAASRLPPGTMTIEGTVQSRSNVRNDRNTVFEVAVSRANDGELKRPCTIEIVLPDKRMGPLVGQHVIAHGRVGTPFIALNPGEERTGPVLSAQFIAVECQYGKSVSLVVSLNRFAADLRNRVQSLARSRLSYQAYGLLDELLLHETMFQDSERRLFSATGTSHILAISGLHLSLIYMLLALLVRPLFVADDSAQLIVSLAGTLVYLAFIDFPLSADRAFMMLAVVGVCHLFGVHNSALVSLSWAAFALTVVDPMSVFDIGLQLSFASVAGLLFIGEPLSRYVHSQNRWRVALWSSVCATVGASLPTAALAARVFHTFAPVTFFANLVVIPAVSLLVPSLLAWSFLVLTFPGLASLTAPILNLAASILFGFLTMLEQIPWSHFNTAAPPPWLLASILICLGIAAVLAENRNRFELHRLSTTPLVMIAALFTISLLATTNHAGTTVTFPVVDQGNALLVRDEKIGTWLCLWDTDARSGRRTTLAAAALGVNRIDNVVFSGTPDNLPAQLDDLVATLSPACIWIPSNAAETKIAGIAPEFRDLIRIFEPDETIRLSYGLSTIMARSDAKDAEPVFVLTTTDLQGFVAFADQQPIGTPGFAYDLRTGNVSVTAAGQTHEYVLSETGCITISTRGKRCWVALDVRR